MSALPTQPVHEVLVHARHKESQAAQVPAPVSLNPESQLHWLLLRLALAVQAEQVLARQSVHREPHREGGATQLPLESKE